MSEHYIEKCSVCGTIISQCRCPNPNKTVRYSICPDCGKPLYYPDPSAMSKQVHLAIRKMIGSMLSNDSLTQVLSIWGEYFRLMKIPKEKQLEEFYTIVGKRLLMKSVITPPEITREGITSE